MSALDLGLSREQARHRAAQLIQELRRGALPAPTEEPLTAEAIDVLHAACELLTERFAGKSSEPADDDRALYDAITPFPPPSSGYEQAGLLADSIFVEPPALLDDARRLYHYASTALWPEPDFGERADVLCKSAFVAWRIARRVVRPQNMDEWQKLFSPKISDLKGDQVFLDQPDMLPQFLENLQGRTENCPAKVLEEATHLYHLLESLEPRYPFGGFLFDEREYFLGELALLAGVTCRHLSRREESRRWFDIAEANFGRVLNGIALAARLSYQKLALAVEERRFEEVLKLAPTLTQSFLELRMPEDALKCHFLIGIAHWELGECRKTIEIYREIRHKAEAIRSVRLMAQASNNLVRYHAVLGETEEALAHSREALPLLTQLGDRVGLTKLRWSIGDFLRAQGRLADAIGAYRAARDDAEDVGMRGDVAGLHLVVADLLLELGQDRQAELEIGAALPIIERESMVPEGFAALSLLRESLRRQEIDRQALRNLHDHFGETKP